MSVDRLDEPLGTFPLPPYLLNASAPAVTVRLGGDGGDDFSRIHPFGQLGRASLSRFSRGQSFRDRALFDRLPVSQGT